MLMGEGKPVKMHNLSSSCVRSIVCANGAKKKNYDYLWLVQTVEVSEDCLECVELLANSNKGAKI